MMMRVDASARAGWILALFAPLLPMGLPTSPAAGQSEPTEKEPIGEVLGRTVYRHEVKKTSPAQLFLAPIVEKYRHRHRAEIVPTEAEIKVAREYFDRKHSERMAKQAATLRQRLEAIEAELARLDLSRQRRRELDIEKAGIQGQLKPPGRVFAHFMLSNWKFQKHLYDKYGGGRVLWQQAGLEAFDAMHQWLKDQESRGHFRITDARIRTSVYHYWTSQDHGAFLTGDSERIRTEFLELAWAPKQSAPE